MIYHILVFMLDLWRAAVYRQFTSSFYVGSVWFIGSFM